jgi:hypothetical protein
MSACRSASHSATLRQRCSDDWTLTDLSNVTFEHPSSLPGYQPGQTMLSLGKKKTYNLLEKRKHTTRKF